MTTKLFKAWLLTKLPVMRGICQMGGAGMPLRVWMGELGPEMCIGQAQPTGDRPMLVEAFDTMSDAVVWAEEVCS